MLYVTTRPLAGLWVTALLTVLFAGGSRASGGGDSGPYQPHVMVSYQWSTRLVMSKVRDRLRAAGYKVWMDTDNIGKHTPGTSCLHPHTTGWLK